MADKKFTGPRFLEIVKNHLAEIGQGQGSEKYPHILFQAFAKVIDAERKHAEKKMSIDKEIQKIIEDTLIDLPEGFEPTSLPK